MYKNILILPDGTELRSGAGTVNAIRSVKLTEMVNSGTELIIGSCCCDMIEATLFTPGGELNITAGDELQLWKEAPDGSRIKMGIYIVEAPTRPTANTMKVAGYDRVSKLDKDLTSWLNGLTGGPYTVNALARLVCQACGLTFKETTGFPNSDFSIKKWSKSGVTGRQIMRWLGEIVCRFVHADPDGNICFKWYEESGKTLLPKGNNYYFAGSFSYENYQVEPVDVVQLRLADSDSGALWPAAAAEDNSYIITGNPILTAYVTEDLLPRLEAIQAELADATYTPCTVSALLDPTARAGSIIHVTDRNGRQIKAYVMEKTSSGQRDTFTCTGSRRRDSSTAANNKTDSEKMAAAASEAINSQTQQDIFNKLTNNGADQGIFMKDGKVYINLEYLKAGSFTSSASVFLEPGQEEFDAIKNHLLGTATISNTALYDFDDSGSITITDALKCKQAMLGQISLASWKGAKKSTVTVTIEASNAQKAIKISGVNMWGRNVEYYIGFNGANLGRILGNLAVSGVLNVGGDLNVDGAFNLESALTMNGKCFAGSETLFDSLPSRCEENRIYLVKAGS